MANVLVATEPGTAYLGIPKDNIRELFRVYMDGQTLYFDFEDDDNAIVRIRRAFWKPVQICSWSLNRDETFTLEMVRDEPNDAPINDKEILGKY